MTKKVQNFSFLVFSSLIFIWAYIIPSFLEEFGKEAWIYVLIGLSLAVLIVIISPKINPQNMVIKILESIYLIICVVFILYWTVNVLSNFLLLDNGVIGPLIPLVIAVLLIEYGNRDTILSTSTVFFLLGFLFLFIPFFLEPSSKQYDLCLPIKMDGSFMKVLIILFIPLDIFHLYRIDISKKEMLFSIIFLFVLTSLYIVNLIATFGEPYLLKMGFPGFMLYENKGSASLFRQIDFLFLYLVPVSVIFNVALRINIIRENLRIPKNILTSVFLGILLVVSVLVINTLGIDLFLTLYILLLVLFVWRLYGLFKRNKKEI